MAWTPRAQLTKTDTRASANSTENTAASLASLPCAMSKLFERTVSSPHDLMAGATGLEPAASCVTGRRSNRLNSTRYWRFCRTSCANIEKRHPCDCSVIACPVIQVTHSRTSPQESGTKTLGLKRNFQTARQSAPEPTAHN